MAPKKIDTDTAPEPEPASAPVVVEAAPAPRRSGLAIAGIAVGAVIAATALFGGGLLVGTHLPQGPGQAQFGPGGDRPQGGFPGGPNENAAPGPMMPHQDGERGDD